MSYSATNLLDLSELPATKRQEVRDFFKFLLSKCSTKDKPATRRFAKLINEPLIVDNIEILSRDSLHDR